jgi:hypothetical protein
MIHSLLQYSYCNVTIKLLGWQAAVIPWGLIFCHVTYIYVPHNIVKTFLLFRVVYWYSVHFTNPLFRISFLVRTEKQKNLLHN